MIPIKVSLRIRPLDKTERAPASTECLKIVNTHQVKLIYLLIKKFFYQ